MQTFQKTSRTEYFDFLRGIATIMVVAIHTFGQAYNYNNISFPAVFLRQIFNCAVPLFCVSSAFFLVIKKDIREGGGEENIKGLYSFTYFFHAVFFI